MNQNESQNKFNQAYERLPPVLQSLRVDINIQGVFAFPEEWKALDDANPGLFGYTVNFLGSELPGGKIVPRELTDKEKREIEEQQAAKNAKKQAKKDTKVDAQVLAEQEEALRKIREAEEEEERLKQVEWDKLDEETKFYRAFEDRYKNAQILFEKRDLSVKRDAQSLVVFEERVFQDGGEWIFVVRQPTLSEEDLAKLRKSKPKTLPNLNELFPVVMRAWIDFTSFRNQGIVETLQRIKLQQYFDETSPPETVKPALDNIYIFLKLNLNNPITPVRKEPAPVFSDVVANAPGVQPLHPSQQCIKDLRAELELIMESLAMEYSNMFAKELNDFADKKQKNMLHTHQKSAVQKRKELFLYDFNVSGKYKILKERIKKSIVKICRDKFGKSGAITGITTGPEDQFYSDLYVFLMDEMRRLMQNMVRDKKEALQEDQLLLKEYAEKNIETQLMQATNETKFELLSRLAEEYEALNNIPQAEKHFKQLMELNPGDHESLYQYALFSLRAGKYKQAEDYMEKALSFNNSNRDYQLLLCVIYIQRDHIKEATMIVRLLLDFDPDHVLWNLVYYLIVSNEPLGVKQLARCERIYMRLKNLLPPSGNHQASPNIYDMPWIKIPIPPPDKVEKDKAVLEKQEQQRLAIEASHQVPKMPKESSDEMFLELISYLEEFNLLELAEKASTFINDQEIPQIVLLKAKVFAHKKKITEAIEIMDSYLSGAPRAYNVQMAKGNLQYISGQLAECETTFLLALRLEEGKTNFYLYLRLGYLYLSKEQYGDARAFFTKACQLKPTSSLSWMGLGVACNKCKLYKDAQLALSQANILEPHNGEILAYLALNAMQDGGRFEDANQALRELKKTDIDKVELLAELCREFYKHGHYHTANQLMQKVLNLADQQDLPVEITTVYLMELAEILYKLGQLSEAKERFQAVLPRIQSREQKQRIEEHIEKIEYQLLIV